LLVLCVVINVFAQDVSNTEPSDGEKLRDKLFEVIRRSNDEILVSLLEEHQKARLLRVRKGPAGSANKIKKAGATAALFSAIASDLPEGKAVVLELVKKYPSDMRGLLGLDVPPPPVKIVFPKADATTPREFRHTVKNGEVEYTIDYARFSLYAPDAKLYYTAGNHPFEWDPAEYPEWDRGPDRTYIGRVKGKPHWIATGYVREDGTVRGCIYIDRRAGWMDFEGNKVIRTWHINSCGTRDVFHYDDRIPLPKAGYGKEPVYEAPMGIDVSYIVLAKVGGSIPVLLELMSMSQMDLVMAFWIDCRIHTPIKQMVLKTTRKACLEAWRWSEFEETFTQAGTPLPEEFYPELAPEERNRKVGGNHVIGLTWPRIWPNHGCHKSLHLNTTSVAALGGATAATHLYPSVRPEPYNKDPYGWQFLTHTYLHEFTHTYHGDHNTGSEEGKTVYQGGGKPHPPKFVGSQVYHYRQFYKNQRTQPKKLKDGTISPVRGLVFAKDTSDVHLPPYACIEMVEVEAGKTKTIDVMANDWDYNSDALTLKHVEPQSRYGGEVEVVDGKAVYTAPPFEAESDRFRYRIADSTGWEATGYVVIRVAPPTRAGANYVIDFGGEGRKGKQGMGHRDTGAAFSVQKGLEYGWNLQRKPTTPPILGQDDKWELALPNGKYFVFIQCGGLFEDQGAGILDKHSYKTANFTQGTGKIPYRNDLLVEGIRFRNMDQVFRDFNTVYDYIARDVTVADGRLTIKAGPNARDVRIKQVVVTQM